MRARAAGVRLSSYVHLGGGPGLHDAALAHRLHELEATCAADAAGREPTPSFEVYVEQRLSGPTFDPRGVVVAHVGEQWIGFTAISVRPPEADRPSGWACSEMTGVLGEHRGSGLSVAVQVPAIRFARRLGLPVLRALHQPEDGAATAMHRRLGLAPEA